MTPVPMDAYKGKGPLPEPAREPARSYAPKAQEKSLARIAGPCLHKSATALGRPHDERPASTNPGGPWADVRAQPRTRHSPSTST